MHKITKTAGVETKTYFSVPYGKLVILPGFNVRSEEFYGDVEGLAKRIARNGISPFEVMVKGGSIIVKNGHRRKKAINWLVENDGWDIDNLMVDCYIEPEGTTETQRIIDMLMHAESEPLNPLDEGRAFKKLMRMNNRDASDIAHLIEKPTEYVTYRVKLVDSEPEVIEAFKEGRISLTAAIETAKHEPEQQKKIATTKKKKITVADVQRKTKGKTYHISGTRVEQLYNEAEEAISTETNPDTILALTHVKYGIEACKNEDVTLSNVIELVKKMSDIN